MSNEQAVIDNKPTNPTSETKTENKELANSREALNLCLDTLYVLTKGFYAGIDAAKVHNSKEFVKAIRQDLENKIKSLVSQADKPSTPVVDKIVVSESK